jgi:hypothetical protein
MTNEQAQRDAATKAQRDADQAQLQRDLPPPVKEIVIIRRTGEVVRTIRRGKAPRLDLVAVGPPTPPATAPPVIGAQREGHGRPRQANAPPTKEDDLSGDDPVERRPAQGGLLPASHYLEQVLARFLRRAA